MAGLIELIGKFEIRSGTARVGSDQLLNDFEVAETELTARLDHRSFTPVVPGGQLDDLGPRPQSLLEHLPKGTPPIVGEPAITVAHPRLGIDVNEPRIRDRNRR